MFNVGLQPKAASFGRCWAIVASLLWAAGSAFAGPADGSRNLLANGDFEQGTATPSGWQTVDGLSSFWVDDPDPAHGKVIRFDTDVLQSQAYAWWERIRTGAAPADAPEKLPTKPPKYDTLAGLDGVWFYSDPVPVEKGRSYWLTADARGGEMMMWLLGYPQEPDLSFGADAAAFQGYLRKKAGQDRSQRGFDRFVSGYDWKGQLKIGGTNTWQTYSRRSKPFRPTAHTPNVRTVRVLILAYWPPGEYFVDNVRLTVVEPEAAERP